MNSMCIVGLADYRVDRTGAALASSARLDGKCQFPKVAP